MKPYQRHLESIQSFGEKPIVKQKPIFRSSAIFPVKVTDKTNSCIHFMGYWLLKRKIPEVSIMYTIRDTQGYIHKRETILVDRIKGFLIDLRKEIPSATSFQGSIELEVFSSRDLVFPYPAFVLEYVTLQGSVFVHSAGRIYNDFEDMQENQSSQVPETGFDILPSDTSVGYFSFVNGAISSPNTIIELEGINAQGAKKLFKKELGDVRPYETRTVLLHELDKSFFGEKFGFVKIRHDLKGLFPRFIAGNQDLSEEFTTLTHTYYDTSAGVDSVHYWDNQDPQSFYDSSIFVPVFGGLNFKTQLAIYPIYAPQNFSYRISLFTNDGNAMDAAEQSGVFDSRNGKSTYIDLSQFAQDEVYGARIDFDGGGRLPSRLKFGLNVFPLGTPRSIPSNICFSAAVPNSKLLSKPGTTKWAPLPNRCRSLVSIDNASFCKVYTRMAVALLRFWRLEDEKFLSRKISIPPNGQHIIDTQSDHELVEFLQGQPGWLTIESENPMVMAWYFEMSDKGLVGADHAF